MTKMKAMTETAVLESVTSGLRAVRDNDADCVVRRRKTLERMEAQAAKSQKAVDQLATDFYKVRFAAMFKELHAAGYTNVMMEDDGYYYGTISGEAKKKLNGKLRPCCVTVHVNHRGTELTVSANVTDGSSYGSWIETLHIRYWGELQVKNKELDAILGK